MAIFEFFNILAYFLWITVPTVASASLEQLNFFVNQNRYKIHSSTFQTTLSMDNIISASLNMALQACQQDFKFERWNCPSMDFFVRRTAKEYQIDQEDAYVTAISTTAIIYTITKECSSGIYSDCGCESNALKMTTCSDDPDKAIKLYEKYMQLKFGDDFCSLVEAHNYKAITNLLRRSMFRQCGCTVSGCSEKNCMTVLKPFNEIASNIKVMYNEGIQVVNAVNTQVIWSNIPLDALVFARDSPNYCDLDAVPQWNGMRGRQCIQSSNGNDVENGSCEHLCHQCGYEVKAENVVIERSCNCQFTFNYQIICESCMEVQQQFYCY